MAAHAGYMLRATCCLLQAQFDIAAERMTRVAKPAARRVDPETELEEMEEAARAAQAMLHHNQALLLQTRTRARPTLAHRHNLVPWHSALPNSAVVAVAAAGGPPTRCEFTRLSTAAYCEGRHAACLCLAESRCEGEAAARGCTRQCAGGRAGRLHHEAMRCIVICVSTASWIQSRGIRHAAVRSEGRRGFD